MPNISAATTATNISKVAYYLVLSRERGLDCRRHPVHRVGLLDHRRIVELRRWGIDVAAGGDHERHVLLPEAGRDWPDVLPLEIHVENGEVETTFLHLIQCAPDGVASTADLMAERIEE